jgi:hypothetical protein
VKHFHSPAQRFRKRRRANRHDHEFLEVHIIIGMGAAVQDVHHGRGKRVRARSSQIQVQRLIEMRGSGASSRHGNRKDRIRAEPAFVLGTVKLDHPLVKAALVGGIKIRQCCRNLAVHVGHGLQHALPEVALFVAIAQLHGLMFAG